MTQEPYLIDMNAAGSDKLPCCGIKDREHPGRKAKQRWLQDNAKFGIRARVLLAPDDKPCGYIEYIPGEFAWRGVEAAGYMFIHCVWIHVKQHQGKGWASLMVQACLEEAKKEGMNGVAAMVRSGPWLADRRLFLANGFEAVDTAPPDYELLVHKFNSAADPAFERNWDRRRAQYGRGLTIIRASQCPYVVKFAAEIAETAECEYCIKAKVVDLKTYRDAQNAPTQYATFSVIYNGRVLADHQISRARFQNIMNKLEM
jgi:GNAT superfamily N-acetyltransferase